MAGWIKMPLGMEVGLSPDDTVLDVDPALLAERGTAASSTFCPMSIVAKQSSVSATAELLLLNSIWCVCVFADAGNATQCDNDVFQGRVSTGACQADGRGGKAGKRAGADEGDTAEGDGVQGKHGEESSFVAGGTTRSSVSVR